MGPQGAARIASALVDGQAVLAVQRRNAPGTGVRRAATWRSQVTYDTGRPLTPVLTRLQTTLAGLRRGMRPDGTPSWSASPNRPCRIGHSFPTERGDGEVERPAKAQPERVCAWAGDLRWVTLYSCNSGTN